MIEYGNIYLYNLEYLLSSWFSRLERRLRVYVCLSSQGRAPIYLLLLSVPFIL